MRAAFGLPATPRTALLVMAAQGGGRIIPLAPVSEGLRIVMLSYELVELTDTPMDPAAATAFTVGVSELLFVVGLAISVVLIGHELRTRSAREALRRAKARVRPPRRTQSPAPAPGLARSQP